ncbi:hypothetical protein Patl1_18544 [Pistacia atlantica]|uniref:Uncharacterized protein n=1 Tax=Pistacia atlantica TaxID=434234 RepID=A0ACC1BZT5_9ROSI|nr:hypothetical protein Patl1_18544 [Pistacia atlantica]
MHQPGIEPGSVPWQDTILPLDHWCWWHRLLLLIISIIISPRIFLIVKTQEYGWKKKPEKEPSL